MWKVFGVEGTIPAFSEIWKQRMIEFSKRKKDRERFLKMIEESEVRYVLDAIREVHVFMVYLPTKYGREDLLFFKEFVVKATEVRQGARPGIRWRGPTERGGHHLPGGLERLCLAQGEPHQDGSRPRRSG